MVKNKSNILYFLLAVVVATAFFAHESITPKSELLVYKTKVWEEHKSKRTKALNELKSSTIGSPLYKAYLIEKKATDIAFNELTKERANQKFLHFKSFRQFMGEFGWAFGLLIYSCFNLIKTFIRKINTSLGETILHSTIAFIAIFYVRWAFLGEYSNISYVVINLICAVSLVFATYLFVKAKERYLDGLKENIRNLISFIFKVTPRSMEDEKWDVLEKVADNE